MKVISPPAHGAFDYLFVVFLFVVPTAESLTGAYAGACYGLAAAYLLVVLVTDFPLGMGEIISYRTHGWLELGSGVGFIASPWLFGFSTANPTARWVFLTFGGALLLLWLLTDWSGRVPSEMTDDPGHNLRGEPLYAAGKAGVNF